MKKLAVLGPMPGISSSVSRVTSGKRFTGLINLDMAFQHFVIRSYCPIPAFSNAVRIVLLCERISSVGLILSNILLNFGVITSDLLPGVTVHHMMNAVSSSSVRL